MRILDSLRETNEEEEPFGFGMNSGNKILGRMTIADRYIYLTFRKKHPIFGKILQALAPKPDIVFVTKVSAKIIRKRKIGQRDRLSEEMISELYDLYGKIPRAKVINNERKIKDNVNFVVNEVLGLLG